MLILSTWFTVCTVHCVVIFSGEDVQLYNQEYWDDRGKELSFVTNSDFLIPIYLYFNVGDLRYLKLSIISDQIMIVWNIKGLHHQITKI